MRLASALLIASCCLHASIATLMGQGTTPEPVVVAQRPKILPNRWQENWSALAGPRITRERFDHLKYIPLSNDVRARFCRWGSTRGLDVVYNNASRPYFDPMPDLSIDDWRVTISSELDIPFFVSKFAWPHLVRRGGGVIINVASVAGMVAGETPPMVGHVAAKAGVIAMTRQPGGPGRDHQEDASQALRST